MSSGCCELSDDLWMEIIGHMSSMHGLCAAKHLRAYARVSRIFYLMARQHPDNIVG